ncbi:MAG: YkgJ family cysteine cluster protein [Dokdonella sp.]|uniref:YkgJ family cysteine cluster protein n=1 Tax=Dokdonella sp. TaxID=2291710 RepID=UPI003263F50B
MTAIECRVGCGACCIAPSISSPIPGMPHGKPAGIPCVQLVGDYACAIFGRPERPDVCRRLRPAHSMCGDHRSEALAILSILEAETSPVDSISIGLPFFRTVSPAA